MTDTEEIGPEAAKAAAMARKIEQGGRVPLHELNRKSRESRRMLAEQQSPAGQVDVSGLSREIAAIAADVAGLREEGGAAKAEAAEAKGQLGLAQAEVIEKQKALDAALAEIGQLKKQLAEKKSK